MANVGLHPGIIMHRGNRLDLPSNLDMTHITHLAAPKKSGDLGTIDMWASKRKADVPFLEVAGIGSKNIIYTEDGWIKYRVPSMRDGSTVLVADLSGDSQAGRGKTPFEIECKGVMLSQGMTFKFDKQMKDEFQVISYREAGDNFVYSVRRIDSDEPVNKLWLQSGNRILPMATFISGEFGQEFPDWNADISGGPEYKIPVGQAEIGVRYHISTKVAKIGNIQIQGDKKKAMDDALEYYFKVPGLDDSGLTTLSDAMNSKKSTQVGQSIASGNVSVAISTLYDSISLRFLARGEQEYMIWGTGGVPLSNGGLDQSLLPVGAWQQLDTGYKTTFNIADFGLHTLKAMYQEYIHGKIDYAEEGAEPMIEIQTGKGGYEMIQRMIASMPNSQSLIIEAKDYNSIIGSGPYGLSYSPLTFVKFRVPMLAWFKVVYNAAFDPIEANELTNPMMTTGYRLSSYSLIVYPENHFGGDGNIKLIRSAEDGNKVWMNVINGRGPGHPLVTTSSNVMGAMASQAAHLGTGYEAIFTKKIDALHIVDPTRILKAVAINPKTKKTF